jgi:hypothetical protein
VACDGQARPRNVATDDRKDPKDLRALSSGRREAHSNGVAGDLPPPHTPVGDAQYQIADAGAGVGSTSTHTMPRLNWIVKPSGE